MGSEHKTNDATTFQPSEPVLCANGCGFFGSTSTMNLCSKCYREQCRNQETAVSVKSAMEKSMAAVPSPIPSASATVEEKVVRKRPSEVTPEEVATSSAESATATTAKGKAGPTRCMTCKKKVGLTGFKCRCEYTFCGSHRYPEEHRCSYDFKTVGRDKIAKANPIVKADKLQRF